MCLYKRAAQKVRLRVFCIGLGFKQRRLHLQWSSCWPNHRIAEKPDCCFGMTKCSHLCSKPPCKICQVNELCFRIFLETLLNIYEDIVIGRDFFTRLVNNTIPGVRTSLAVMAGDVIFCSQHFHKDQTIVIWGVHAARHRGDSPALNSGVHRGECVSAYLGEDE